MDPRDEREDDRFGAALLVRPSCVRARRFVRPDLPGYTGPVERDKFRRPPMPDSFDLPNLTRQVADALPVAPVTLKLGGEATGLIIVDEVNGFANVGAGSMAPPKDNPQVAAMVEASSDAHTSEPQ